MQECKQQKQCCVTHLARRHKTFCSIVVLLDVFFFFFLSGYVTEHTGLHCGMSRQAPKNAPHATRNWCGSPWSGCEKKKEKKKRGIWPSLRLDEWWHCRRVLINTRAEQTRRRRGQHLAKPYLLESRGCNFAALVTQSDKLTRVFKSLLVPTSHLV